jgi:RimJ/RimL family protein N-acetyltransferase
MPNIVNFSGFRLGALSPEQRVYAGQELIKRVLPFAPVIAAATMEPYFLDDIFRVNTAENLLLSGIQHGEIFICTENDQVIAFMMLSDILHERSATFEGWAHRDYRQDYTHRKVLYKLGKEVIEYAFRPYGAIKDGGGLGLKKLKARIAEANTPSLKAARAYGFKQVGRSPADGLYQGIPVDTILLELLNPAFFGLAAPEVLTSEVEQAASAPHVHAAAAVPSAATGASAGLRTGARPEGDNPAGIQRDPSDEQGRRGGSATPAVAPVHQPKPSRSRR